MYGQCWKIEGHISLTCCRGSSVKERRLPPVVCRPTHQVNESAVSKETGLDHGNEQHQNLHQRNLCTSTPSRSENLPAKAVGNTENLPLGKAVGNIAPLMSRYSRLRVHYLKRNQLQQQKMVSRNSETEPTEPTVAVYSQESIKLHMDSDCVSTVQ